MAKPPSQDTIINSVRELYHKGKSNHGIGVTLKLPPYKVDWIINQITNYNEHQYCHAYHINRDEEPAKISYGNQHTDHNDDEI